MAEIIHIIKEITFVGYLLLLDTYVPVRKHLVGRLICFTSQLATAPSKLQIAMIRRRTEGALDL